MKNKIILILLITLENYLVNTEDEPQWVTDMLQMGSSNGISSLTAPIISPKNAERRAAASGREITMGANEKSTMDMPQSKSSGPKEDEIMKMSVMNTVPEPEHLRKGSSEDYVVYDNPLEPNFTENSDQPNPNNEPDVVIVDYIQDYAVADDKSDDENDYFVVTEKQPSLHRNKKLPVFKPGPINPIAQLLQSRMFLQRDNQEQVILNAYKRLTEMNNQMLHSLLYGTPDTEDPTDYEEY